MHAHISRQFLLRPETAEFKPHGVSPPKSQLSLRTEGIIILWTNQSSMSICGDWILFKKQNSEINNYL